METKSLIDLKQNQVGIVQSLTGSLHLKRRLLDLGLTTGTSVKVINVSPLKNSFLLEIHGYILALRQNAVRNILVVQNESE